MTDKNSARAENVRRHDFDLTVDIDGLPFLCCVVCGMVVPHNAPVANLATLVCSGYDRFKHNFDLPRHVNAPCDPRDKWVYAGDNLIDAWMKERGE